MGPLTESLLPRLRCLECGRDSDSGLGEPVCPACQTARSVDDVGILRLSERDGRWPGVAPAFATAVVRSRAADEVIDAMTSGPTSLPGSLQQQLLQPSGGAAAVLAPARERLSVLDLGTGWSNLSRALRSMGFTVTVADWSYARLRFCCLMQEPAPDLAVHLEAGRELPFADQSFDVVFADSRQIDLALRERGAHRKRDREGQLSEIHRVVREGGSIIYGTSNPLRRWRDTTESRRLAGLARSISVPWGERELARVGFSGFRTVAAHPRRAVKHWLIPLDRLGDYLRESRPTASRAQAVKHGLRASAATVGAARWLVSDYFVVAGKGVDPRDRQPTLMGSLEPFHSDETPLVQMLSDARVALLGTHDFVKFPLSPSQQRALLAEVDKTTAARATELRDFVIPSASVREWNGVPYTVFPRIERRRDASPAEALRVLGTALDSHSSPRFDTVDQTALWRRMSRPRGLDDIAELEAQALHRAVVATCAECVVPIGPTHGDLHVDNVLLTPEGRGLLVDWNRFEADNPLFLDPAYAAVRGHQRRTRATFAASLTAFAEGDLDDALDRRATALLGDLDRFHAAALLLLDRIVSYSEPRRRNKPWTMGPLLDAVGMLSSRLP